MAPTFRDILADARSRQAETAPADVQRRRQSGESFVLIDVRESDEHRAGFVPGATHIPRGFLELRIENAVPDRDTPIVLYCAGGTRSVLAAQTLSAMGYRHLESMAGGFTEWARAGLPVEKPVTLSESDRRRYSRHLIIPEIGEKGQATLLASKVLMIGAGGLGSPAAYYLAAAGVGTLGLVDFDVVDESNLQRQILHAADRVGTPKIASATKTLTAFNPALKVVPFEERLDSRNIDRIIEGFDLVVDGSDNFPTRYLVNDACVKHRKPCVHGSVYRFEGQVTVFDPVAGGPCYRCLYPSPPPPDMAPSCAEAGVLGVLPGVIGVLQAVETLKVLVGFGKPLIGRLLHYDALETKFREFKLRRDPQCAYCGEGKAFPGYIDYEFFCANPK
jgi:molybdopterin/thiamine biosynthesis adenylyltransferase/rhodanese-related sulfurtransferase